MEGQGITNYNSSTPSYGLTASTTEFDDELIKRGVVTHEQAIMAKGATQQQAEQLVDLHRRGKTVADTSEKTSDGGDDSSDDDDLLDDDDFLEQYRQQRLNEMRRQRQQALTTEPAVISRNEWTREVNEDSNRRWVVVCLTSSDTERTGRVEQAVRVLASRPQEHAAKFVFIPSKSAILNWPDSNLPSIFLYRHGTMQQELVRMNPETSADELENLLAQGGVFDNEVSVDPE